jgi:hypothetical protein
LFIHNKWQLTDIIICCQLAFQLFFGLSADSISPSGAKTFGLTRFTVTPKDFTPTRQWRDRSIASIRRNTHSTSPNRNTAPVAEINTPAPKPPHPALTSPHPLQV